MEFRVRITNARIQIYRGGDRRLWVYTDSHIEAEMYNIQVSHFFKEQTGGSRLIFELATRDEDILNRIDSYDPDTKWTVSGSIVGAKHLIGKCKDYEGEERIILKLADVHLRPMSTEKVEKGKRSRRFKVVPGPKYREEMLDASSNIVD